MSMPPQQKEDYETAINDLQWLSIQNSSEDETSSPLMQLSSASSSSSSLTDYSSHMYRSRPQSPSSSPSRPSRKLGKCIEYGVKNARDALVGSISAVINFLRISGVPKPSCDQLDKNLDLGRYFAVLKRVQDYIQCLHSESEDETMAKIHLAVSAWEALTQLKSLEYKRAYKHCYHLRYEIKGKPLEIKQAIAVQVQIAEQCTACHKKLYLVQKWERHWLTRLKKVSVIEPQGYQPIRCL